MIALINPNIVMQKDDFFGTGIPYMPVELAYTAAVLRKAKIPFSLIDSFGENPAKIIEIDNQLVQGLTNQEILRRINPKSKFVVVYCGLVVTFRRITEIIAAVKEKFPRTRVICIENTQQVTAFSVRETSKDLFKAGADILVVGDPEHRIIDIVKGKKLSTIPGIIYKTKSRPFSTKFDRHTLFIKDVDNIPFPAWDLFPVRNYWKLGYAHAPFTSKKYIPLLTSRGCPFGCHFCLIPATNIRRWTPRSAKNVVDEMEYWMKFYGLSEFHIEDLNPTVRKERWVEISREILSRKLRVKFKFGAGTKIETLDGETIDWMAKAGLAYLSCSPESGSPKVLKAMDKPFNHEYALKLISQLSKKDVTTQACFVLGYLNENNNDRKLTQKYVKALAKAGIDEIALFIMTPIPGTYTYDKVEHAFGNYSQLTFSPRWRREFRKLNRFRMSTYIKFILWKLRYHPLKLFKQPMHFLKGDFNTKMEMTAFRWLKLNVLSKF